MLVCILAKLSVAQFMVYLKGKSRLMIFDRHANLKYKYGNRYFGCRGYYVDTVVRNKTAIAEYIKNQRLTDFQYLFRSGQYYALLGLMYIPPAKLVV